MDETETERLNGARRELQQLDDAESAALRWLAQRDEFEADFMARLYGLFYGAEASVCLRRRWLVWEAEATATFDRYCAFHPSLMRPATCWKLWEREAELELACSVGSARVTFAIWSSVTLQAEHARGQEGIHSQELAERYALQSVRLQSLLEVTNHLLLRRTEPVPPPIAVTQISNTTTTDGQGCGYLGQPETPASPAASLGFSTAASPHAPLAYRDPMEALPKQAPSYVEAPSGVAASASKRAEFGAAYSVTNYTEPPCRATAPSVTSPPCGQAKSISELVRSLRAQGHSIAEICQAAGYSGRNDERDFDALCYSTQLHDVGNKLHGLSQLSSRSKPPAPSANPVATPTVYGSNSCYSSGYLSSATPDYASSSYSYQYSPSASASSGRQSSSSRSVSTTAASLYSQGYSKAEICRAAGYSGHNNTRDFAALCNSGRLQNAGGKMAGLSRMKKR